MGNAGVFAVAAIVATAIVYPHSFVSAASTAKAKVEEFYTTTAHKPMTKIEATRLLLTTKTQVFKCYQVELNEKVIIKRKGVNNGRL